MKLVQVASVYYHTRLEMIENRLRGFISETVKADKYYLVFGKEGLPIGGFGTTKDGWLLGLFSLKRGLGDELIELALKTLRTDAIDVDTLRVFCTGEFLKKRYSKEGFEVYSTILWDDRQAPKSWNKLEFGEPSLYFMRMSK